jgi:antitoxin HicB
MNVDEYLGLPYTISLTPEQSAEAPAWVARVDDLPGCVAQAESRDGALDRVQDAMRVWISTALEEGVEVPKPRADSDYSGRFLVRVPRGLHGRLAREAQRQGTSLNQFVSSALAGAVGWRSAPEVEDESEDLAAVMRKAKYGKFGSFVELTKGTEGLLNVQPQTEAAQAAKDALRKLKDARTDLEAAGIEVLPFIIDVD